MAPPSVRVLLFNSKLGDLLKRKEKLKVVSIRESVTVETALATLAKHKILSAPVLSQPTDEAVGQDGDLECLCFVDIRDVLNAFLQSGPPNVQLHANTRPCMLHDRYLLGRETRARKVLSAPESVVSGHNGVHRSSQVVFEARSAVHVSMHQQRIPGSARPGIPGCCTHSLLLVCPAISRVVCRFLIRLRL